MGPDSFQWCAAKGAAAKNCDAENSIKILGSTSLFLRCQSTGTGSPESLWSILP